jgi:hypothetical protein
MGSMIGKKSGDIWKAKIIFKAMKGTKKDIMGAININVSVKWKLNSCFKIHGNENDFMDNLFDYQWQLIIF